MRLINTDAIKLPKGFFEKVNNVPKFYDWLNGQPTIDPVKHGKWLVKGQDIYCSCCGQQSLFNWWGASAFSLYCPNCGAEMENDNE